MYHEEQDLVSTPKEIDDGGFGEEGI